MLRLSKRQKETRKAVETMLEEMRAQTPTHLRTTRVVEETMRVTPATHSQMTPVLGMTLVEMLVAEKMPTHSPMEEKAMTQPEQPAEMQVVEMRVVVPTRPMLVVEAMQQPTPIHQRESPPQNPL